VIDADFPAVIKGGKPRQGTVEAGSFSLWRVQWPHAVVVTRGGVIEIAVCGLVQANTLRASR